MIGTLAVALELADFIRRENQHGNIIYPTSTTHLNLWSSHFSISLEIIQNILGLLEETHFIFIFNLGEPDESLFSKGESLFFFADSTIINDLILKTKVRLEDAYTEVYFRRKSAFQIVQEFFTKLHSYKDSEISRYIKILMMLEEYLKIIDKNKSDYIDISRQSKIFEAYDKNRLQDDLHTSIDEVLSVSDPVVEPLLGSFDEEDHSNWSKAKRKFSLEFLIRIHFRKYEFEVVKRLIQVGKIKSEQDLKIVRDTLVKVESKDINVYNLPKFQFEINQLRQYCNRKIYSLRNSQTSKV
ncbi:hypothetical protein AB3N58_17485 (plasmid) [Leptospira sp. WS60.C2]